MQYVNSISDEVFNTITLKHLLRFTIAAAPFIFTQKTATQKQTTGFKKYM
jgi:hypothetical protein